MSALQAPVFVGYVCPDCKTPIRESDSVWICSVCGKNFPVTGGIPDFLAQSDLAADAPNLRWIQKLEFLAPVYEGDAWHNFILRTLARASHSSLAGIAEFIAETMLGVRGAILDVACGPATYGRRIASLERAVFGIDFSLGTLQQGMKFIARDGVASIRLSRNRVEALPFADSVFQGAVVGGSLHLFPDTRAALREIARTMADGAPLAVTTFVEGKTPMTALLRRRKTMHIFRLPELRATLAESGFEDVHTILDGTFLMLKATRKIQGN